LRDEDFAFQVYEAVTLSLYAVIAGEAEHPIANVHGALSRECIGINDELSFLRYHERLVSGATT
jgi:hypothetical protein